MRFIIPCLNLMFQVFGKLIKDFGIIPPNFEYGSVIWPDHPFAVGVRLRPFCIIEGKLVAEDATCQ